MWWCGLVAGGSENDAAAADRRGAFRGVPPCAARERAAAARGVRLAAAFPYATIAATGHASSVVYKPFVICLYTLSLFQQQRYETKSEGKINAVSALNNSAFRQLFKCGKNIHKKPDYNPL